MIKQLKRVKFVEPVYNPFTRAPSQEVNSGPNISLEFDTETRTGTLTALVRDPSKKQPASGPDDRPMVPNPANVVVIFFAENVAYAY